MGINIDGKLLSCIPRTLKELFNMYPNIKAVASKFIKEPIQTVESKHSLYVGQGEYAVIPAQDKTIKVLGSDDATTCHILILKNSSGTVAVAHFDGHKKERDVFKDIIDEFKKIDYNVSSLDAFVIGGYDSFKENTEEKKNISEELSLNLLNMFYEHSIIIQLLLWCTCELNTKYINDCPFPIFNGLAINKETLNIFPAVFSEQCPNYTLRSASRWVNLYQDPINIYNYEKKCVLISPFYDWNRNYYAACSQLSDCDILNYFSTSPKVEPPQFCNRLRNVFFLLGYRKPETLFPCMKPKIYIINSEGLWIEK